MTEIKELTETQYNILSSMGRDYCYGFNYFDYPKKQLSKEFKILREAGLVYFANGLMTEDGEVCGSGYGLNNVNEVDKLLEEWEEEPEDARICQQN